MTASAHHRSGAVLCLVSGAAFGSMAIFGKLAYDDGVTVGTLLFARFGLAALVLWAVLAMLRRLPRPDRRTLGTALALGGVGYATQAGLFFAALERMDASLLALVLYTYPALVTATAIVIGRETASRRRIAALLLSSGGLVLVLAAAGRGGFDALAVGMGLGAAATYTAYILISDVTTKDVEPLALSTLVITGAAVTFGIGGAVTGNLDAGFAPQAWLWLAGIALVCTVAAIVCFFAGLQRVGPSGAAILSTFEPVTTVVLAFLVFGDRLTLGQLGGGVLVVAAVIVLNARRRNGVTRIPAWATTRKLRSNTS